MGMGMGMGTEMKQASKRYDLSKIGKIVNALRDLKEDAAKSNYKELEHVIDTAFENCFDTYFIALSLLKRPGELADVKEQAHPYQIR